MRCTERLIRLIDLQSDYQMVYQLTDSREEQRKTREREMMVTLGAPKKRRHVEDIPSLFEDVAFLRTRFEVEKRVEEVDVDEFEELFDFQI